MVEWYRRHGGHANRASLVTIRRVRFPGPSSLNNNHWNVASDQIKQCAEGYPRMIHPGLVILLSVLSKSNNAAEEISGRGGCVEVQSGQIRAKIPELLANKQYYSAMKLLIGKASAIETHRIMRIRPIITGAQGLEDVSPTSSCAPLRCFSL